jgi:NADPH:quinone reductase-like Zn-dependent oxidoreductase
MKLFSNNPSPARIAELTASAEAGSIRPVIDTVYPITGVAEAHERLETGGVRGKLIIDMRL